MNLTTNIPTEITKDIVSLFNDAMRAAVAARAPVPWRRRQLEFNALEIQQGVTNIFSPSEYLSSSTPLQSRYRAALNVFFCTGSFDLVLDGLTARKLARSELARSIRWTLIYLTALLFGAATLLSFFNQSIVVVITQMRTDMTLVPAVQSQQVDTVTWIPTLVGIFSWAWPALLLFVILGGSSYLAWCVGGWGYETDFQCAITLRMAGQLAKNSVPLDVAVAVASMVVGANRRVQNSVREAVQELDVESGIPTDLTVAVSDFQSAAERRLSMIQLVLPILMLTIVGGTAVLAYSVAVFWPVVALLKDLSLPGIQT